MILLELDKINLLFGDKRIIRDLNFKMNEEEIIGLVGPTQAGKTIFFDLISGVYEPTSGKIIFEGQDITSFSIEKTNSIGIARTFQDGYVFDDLTVADNIKAGFYNSLDYELKDVVFRNSKFLSEEQKLDERVEELLDIFDLNDYKNKVASELPYATRSKLGIARAVATNPKLLLLDRPTNGMDPDEAKELMSVIEMVNKKFKTAIIIIENDVNLIMDICNRIAVMEYGIIIAIDSPVEIKNNQALISVCTDD